MNTSLFSDDDDDDPANFNDFEFPVLTAAISFTCQVGTENKKIDLSPEGVSDILKSPWPGIKKYF